MISLKKCAFFKIITHVSKSSTASLTVSEALEVGHYGTKAVNVRHLESANFDGSVRGKRSATNLHFEKTCRMHGNSSSPFSGLRLPKEWLVCVTIDCQFILGKPVFSSISSISSFRKKPGQSDLLVYAENHYWIHPIWKFSGRDQNAQLRKDCFLSFPPLFFNQFAGRKINLFHGSLENGWKSTKELMPWVSREKFFVE